MAAAGGSIGVDGGEQSPRKVHWMPPPGLSRDKGPGEWGLFAQLGG